MTLYTHTPVTGYSVAFNITAATVIKTGPGLIAKIFIIVAGSGLGSVNDCATTGAVAVGNQIAAVGIAGAAGTKYTAGDSFILEAPFSLGLCVTPGTGSTLAVSYS
jgi:hypothetical protein